MDLELGLLVSVEAILGVCLVLTIKAKRELKNTQATIMRLQERMRLYND